MIRLLAQIVARQVLPPKEGLRAIPDPPGERIPSVSHPRSRAKGPSAGTEPLAASMWPEPPTQALVVLFTELAQRRVQALHQQEEIHE